MDKIESLSSRRITNTFVEALCFPLHQPFERDTARQQWCPRQSAAYHPRTIGSYRQAGIGHRSLFVGKREAGTTIGQSVRHNTQKAIGVDNRTDAIAGQAAQAIIGHGMDFPIGLIGHHHRTGF